MNFSESFYLSNLLTLTNSLIVAGESIVDAPAKALLLLNSVRVLAEQEAQERPLPDPQQEFLLKQEQAKIDAQAYYDAKRAEYEAQFNENVAIDYDN